MSRPAVYWRRREAVALCGSSLIGRTLADDGGARKSDAARTRSTSARLPLGVPSTMGERMPMLIERPAVIEAAGNLPKRIEEYVGRVNSASEHVSVARVPSRA